MRCLYFVIIVMYIIITCTEGLIRFNDPDAQELTQDDFNFSGSKHEMEKRRSVGGGGGRSGGISRAGGRTHGGGGRGWGSGRGSGGRRGSSSSSSSFSRKSSTKYRFQYKNPFQGKPSYNPYYKQKPQQMQTDYIPQYGPNQPNSFIPRGRVGGARIGGGTAGRALVGAALGGYAGYKLGKTWNQGRFGYFNSGRWVKCDPPSKVEQDDAGIYYIPGDAEFDKKCEYFDETHAKYFANKSKRNYQNVIR